MTPARVLAAGAIATLLAVVPATASRRGSGEDAGTQPVPLEGGRHWRIGTPRGTVHAWCPAGYDSRAAGTVVYVHGYFATADTAWSEDRLAAQFRESGLNALYVVPEAPSSGDEPVVWPALGALLATVRAETGMATAPGPVVVVGHSGAWRTLEMWLHERTLGHVILLDALYGSTAPFRSWLRSARSRSAQLVVVAADTMSKAVGLTRGLRGVVKMPSVPEDSAGFSRGARLARVLLLRSQYEHTEMISEGKVIPVLLRLTGLKAAGAGAAVGGYGARPTRASSAEKRRSDRRTSTRGSTFR